MASLLVVTPLAPWPVRDGHTLRAAHLIEALANDWEVTLLAPAGPVPDGIDRVEVALRGACTVPWRYDFKPLRVGLDGLLARRPFDRALVFAGAEAAWFGREREPSTPPAAVDLIDCNALEFWRAARRTAGLRGRFYWLRQAIVSVPYARRGFAAFAATVCVGETDAAWLRRMGGRDVHVVPNGVTLPPEPPGPAADPVLSFTGSLDYHPNIDAAIFAAKAVFPRVRAAMPEARLLIAGRRPVPSVLELAALEGVEVAADVADMDEVLARTRVALAPMRAGSGIKNKVLEAWANARPVVMSRIAANGLSLPEGHAGLVNDAAEAQASAAVALLRDPARAATLGVAARAHVAAAFSWGKQAAALGRILKDAGTPR
ncbi:MAG TPA: glycosyltransferase family 4 protein [Acetobacteraceae bacterium]